MQAEAALSWFERALQHPAGSFAFIFAIMVAIVLATYMLTRWTTKWTCQAHEDRGKVTKVSDHIDAIRSDIVFIKGTLNGLAAGGNAGALIQAHSPISLTDFGKELAVEMNLSDIIQRNWDKIRTYLEDNLQSKNAYDIQQFCIDTASVNLDKFFDVSDVNIVKNFAFKKGQNIIYYGGMIGIMIRDDYFRHKGINIDDVDKHDPQRQA